MGKVIALCGKICSGKTYYAKNFKNRAVILSCDEVTSMLFDNNLREQHLIMLKKIQSYLLKKAEDIIACDIDVVLDWGFWAKKDRDYVKNYFKERNIDCQLHYIDIDEKSWQKNIDERNKRVLDGNGGCDYYFDEKLKNTMFSFWEEPSEDEIDKRVVLKR